MTYLETQYWQPSTVTFDMIRIVLTIEEEVPGAIRVKGAGEDVGGMPTHLEVEFAKEVMQAANSAAEKKFKKSETFTPLTFIETREKPDEHKDRS